MLNHIVLTGRLTKDPELRTTPSGTQVAAFTLAVERDIKNAEGKRETDFIECVAWRTTAAFIAKTFHKGDGLSVIGRLQTRSYTDKDNNKRRAVEVNVDSAYFQIGKSEVRTETGTMPIIPDEEDLPFD